MPVFNERDIEEFPIGNRPLSEHQAGLAREGLHFHPHAWVVEADLKGLSPGGPSALVDARNTPLAWFGTYADPSRAQVATDSFLIVHPWDLLRANEMHLASLAAEAGDWENEGTIDELARIDGKVRLGPGSCILAGVFIEGNVIIGADCKIGPNCYLRGNTSIGDRCHVGNAVEIKNSILLSGTKVGHLSYVGDSILGERVNLGAGTIVSNLRHDGANVLSQASHSLVDTGRRKFGCIIGDGVHTGIHTSIYPGRKLYPGTTTRPGEVVQHDLT